MRTFEDTTLGDTLMGLPASCMRSSLESEPHNPTSWKEHATASKSQDSPHRCECHGPPKITRVLLGGLGVSLCDQFLDSKNLAPGNVLTSQGCNSNSTEEGDAPETRHPEDLRGGRLGRGIGRRRRRNRSLFSREAAADAGSPTAPAAPIPQIRHRLNGNFTI